MERHPLPVPVPPPTMHPPHSSSTVTVPPCLLFMLQALQW